MGLMDVFIFCDLCCYIYMFVVGVILCVNCLEKIRNTREPGPA